MVILRHDRIEYLVNLRFPNAKAIEAALSSLMRGSTAREAGVKERIAAYRGELESLTEQEFEARYSAEKAKAEAAIKRDAEQKERQLFFHQPNAKADYAYWSKAAYWTLDEASALSLGKAPEVVTWEKVKSLVNVSPFAVNYGRQRELALRAKASNQLFDPVLPGFFLAWAKRTDFGYPPELEAAVAARGVQVADWKKLYDESMAETAKNQTEWSQMLAAKNDAIDALQSEIGSLKETLAQPPVDKVKSLGTRERESLLKLVIGMAVGGYGYDPAASRNPQTSAITSDLAEAGVSLDEDTVRKWLREGAGLLPREGGFSER